MNFNFLDLFYEDNLSRLLESKKIKFWKNELLKIWKYYWNLLCVKSYSLYFFWCVKFWDILKIVLFFFC